MRHHLKSEFVFLPSDTKIKVFFVMFSAVVMFRSHAEAGMSVPPLTTASTEHKLSLFAITITFCLHVKHEPVDWTSSCPSSRGRSSHSGKYGEIAVGAGGDEACKGGKSEYTVKVNYDTIKELTVRSQQHALMKYNTATLSIYSKCLHMDTGWQISWDANLSETQSFFFFFFSLHPVTADSTSNALFFIFRCVYYSEDNEAAASVWGADLAGWHSGASHQQRLLQKKKKKLTAPHHLHPKKKYKIIKICSLCQLRVLSALTGETLMSDRIFLFFMAGQSISKTQGSRRTSWISLPWSVFFFLYGPGVKYLTQLWFDLWSLSSWKQPTAAELPLCGQGLTAAIHCVSQSQCQL